VSFIERFHYIQDSQLGPSGVLYKEVPLYIRIMSFSLPYIVYLKGINACSVSMMNMTSSVCRFPPLSSGTKHAQSLLLRNLKSCDIRSTPTGWACTLCMDQNILLPPTVGGGENLIHQTFEFPARDNVGTCLVHLWMSMVTLLDPVLELTAFCTREWLL